MSTQLVRVPFHDDTLEATQLPDLRVMVSIRRVCDLLALDFSSQLAKLKSKPWATVVTITTVAEDQRTRQLAAIELDELPMWLANIDTGRVDAGARQKLELYQKECTRVLRNHFFGRKSTGDDILDLLEDVQRSTAAIADNRRRTLALQREVNEVRGIAECAQATAVAVMETVNNRQGYYTILAYCKLTRREVSTADAIRHGKDATRVCRARGIIVQKVTDARYGEVNIYPLSVLQNVFDDEEEPIPI